MWCPEIATASPGILDDADSPKIVQVSSRINAKQSRTPDCCHYSDVLSPMKNK